MHVRQVRCGWLKNGRIPWTRFCIFERYCILPVQAPPSAAFTGRGLTILSSCGVDHLDRLGDSCPVAVKQGRRHLWGQGWIRLGARHVYSMFASTVRHWEETRLWGLRECGVSLFGQVACSSSLEYEKRRRRSSRIAHPVFHHVHRKGRAYNSTPCDKQGVRNGGCMDLHSSCGMGGWRGLGTSGREARQDVARPGPSSAHYSVRIMKQTYLVVGLQVCWKPLVGSGVAGCVRVFRG